MTDAKNTTEAGWDLDALLAQVHDPELAMMLRELATAPAIYQPSQFWKEFVRLNIKQIQEDGQERFKLSVNQNYFNWAGDLLKEQKEVLARELGAGSYQRAWVRGWFTLQNRFKPRSMRWRKWRRYLTFLHLIWNYTSTQDRLGWLRQLEEPPEGQPWTVRREGKYISQDICNSLLELNAALEGKSPPPGETIRCAELGAGYGRIGYCLLKQCPNLKYTVIDIPPALHLSQWYLTRTLPGRKVFRCRPFANFENVRAEFEAADIAFLLPHQVELLPDKCFDRFFNISSLQEMTHDQIRFWFAQIDRLCRGRFYSKQWIRFENEIDHILVQREDYPAPAHWREIFNRQVIVQPRFFEALYDLENK